MTSPVFADTRTCYARKFLSGLGLAGSELLDGCLILRTCIVAHKYLQPIDTK